MTDFATASTKDDYAIGDDDRLHFHKVCAAFRCYRRFELNRIGVAERQFFNLAERHRMLLPNHEIQLAKMAECVDTNHQFLMNILEANSSVFENADLSAADCLNDVPQKKAKVNGSPTCCDPASDCESAASTNFGEDRTGYRMPPVRVIATDIDKVRSTLKQFVRDWSSYGEHERRACYDPILAELRNLHPVEAERSKLRVLLPGSGLCRLAWEVARLGFETHANEVSFYMLLAANFVLNRCCQVNEFTIHPFVHESCNNLRFADQVAAVSIPDCDPNALTLAAATSQSSSLDSSTSSSTRFEMSAGDFVEIYSRPAERGRYDCVVTMFFIDTAHNIVEYVETIANALRPGGHWINLGPLLYHYAGMPSELSIEIAYDELRALAGRCGFSVELERSVSSGYCQNTRSMLQFVYNSQFFVARKV